MLGNGASAAWSPKEKTSSPTQLRCLMTGRWLWPVYGRSGKTRKKWKDSKSGDQIESCTILTCGPNKVIGELHNRMPVILSEPDWPKWLGEEPAAEEELLSMLKPCPDESLKIWPVNKMVGNVRNKGPQLAMPL